VLNHRTTDVALSRTFAAETAVVGVWGGDATKLDQPTRPAAVEKLVADARQVLHGVICTYGGELVRRLTGMQPRYTRSIGADVTPVPLQVLCADARLPLPDRSGPAGR
jgi:hypothetical protein